MLLATIFAILLFAGLVIFAYGVVEGENSTILTGISVAGISFSLILRFS